MILASLSWEQLLLLTALAAAPIRTISPLNRVLVEAAALHTENTDADAVILSSLESNGYVFRGTDERIHLSPHMEVLFSALNDPDEVNSISRLGDVDISQHAFIRRDQLLVHWMDHRQDNRCSLAFPLTQEYLDENLIPAILQQDPPGIPDILPPWVSLNPSEIIVMVLLQCAVDEKMKTGSIEEPVFIRKEDLSKPDLLSEGIRNKQFHYSPEMIAVLLQNPDLVTGILNSLVNKGLLVASGLGYGFSEPYWSCFGIRHYIDVGMAESNFKDGHGKNRLFYIMNNGFLVIDNWQDKSSGEEHTDLIPYDLRTSGPDLSRILFSTERLMKNTNQDESDNREDPGPTSSL